MVKYKIFFFFVLTKKKFYDQTRVLAFSQVIKEQRPLIRIKDIEVLLYHLDGAAILLSGESVLLEDPLRSVDGVCFRGLHKPCLTRSYNEQLEFVDYELIKYTLEFFKDTSFEQLSAAIRGAKPWNNAADHRPMDIYDNYGETDLEYNFCLFVKDKLSIAYVM